MKYKDLYPNLKPIFEQANDPYANVIKSEHGEGRPCHVCKDYTEYVDIDYEGPFCSHECLAKFEKSIGV